jgi:hypothetical protein
LVPNFLLNLLQQAAQRPDECGELDQRYCNLTNWERFSVTTDLGERNTRNAVRDACLNHTVSEDRRDHIHLKILHW